MDVVGQREGDRAHARMEETLPGIESKKHRMHTGQDSGDFSKRYELLDQLGSGASGTVWKCRLAHGQPGGRPGGAPGDEPLPGVIYAAKIIDLRPFKLRERFSMQRLMREVNIMRRLRHPNIISLVEALDSAEQLVLVLEYAPGVELFDAILSKNSFTEEAARPVFVQVARALQYMHTMHIVHRDVKPENVMIINRPSSDGNLYPEAKLLDFGLSKAIDADGGGSVARTFVGTPSYLAPEVEEKPGGKGKPYGTPVDCWSLGAMLYVMLVARFPEFTVQGVRKYVRMQGPLWNKVSLEAKQLIQSLMAFDPGARLTIDKALSHPWLGDLAEKPVPASFPLQRMPSGMGRVRQEGPAPPRDMAFTVPSAVLAGSSAAPTVDAEGAGRFSSPPARPKYRESGGNGNSGGLGVMEGSWGGKPPIVTEQETPPSSHRNKKSFEFTPSGPTIRELHSDESPLSSVDSGMLEKMEVGSAATTRALASTKKANNNTTQSAGNLHVAGSNGNTGLDHGNSSGGSNSSKWNHDRMQEQQTAMVALYGAQGMGITMPPDEGIPLLQLQNRIKACLETAVSTYSDCPEAAASLRKSAALCRESLRDSVTLLRKIERMAEQVLTLFPDLTLAVEEGEPELAHDFFSTVKGWVRDMYTAVSLVQAKNSENAKQVGDAMQRHAEIGRNARLKYEQLLERQQQHQQQRPPPPPALHPQPPGYIGASSVAGGGEAPEARGAGDKTPGNGVAGYVLKDDGNDSERLNGYVGMDATRQGDLIAVDPETFEVVRQIKAYRSNLAAATATSATATADGSEAAEGHGHNTAAATSDASSPAVEALSDEKLINLFLLIARGSPGTVPQPSSTNAVRQGGSGGLGAAVAAVVAPAAPSSSVGDGEVEGMAVPMGGETDRAPLGGDGGGASGEVMGAVEAMFAVRSTPQEDGAAARASVDGSGFTHTSATATTAPASDESSMAANLTSQMSIDDSNIRDDGNTDGGVDGGAGRHATETLWGGRKEHELQLARTDGDKVFMEVQRALQMLHEVDSVLEQLALFWANSEVIFDVLLRKADLVEKFVAFANKPRLLQSFRERLADYKRFWQGVQGVCNKYVCGQFTCNGGSSTTATSVGAGGGVGAATTFSPHNRAPSAASSAGGGGSFGKDATSQSDSSHAPSSPGMGMGLGMGEMDKEELGGAGGWANVDMGMDSSRGNGRGGGGGGT